MKSNLLRAKKQLSYYEKGENGVNGIVDWLQEWE